MYVNGPDTIKVYLRPSRTITSNWDNQPLAVVSPLLNRFGTNWKTRVCEYLSWYGLNETPGFTEFLINENITSAEFEQIVDLVRSSCTNTCN